MGNLLAATAFLALLSFQGAAPNVDLCPPPGASADFRRTLQAIEAGTATSPLLPALRLPLAVAPPESELDRQVLAQAIEAAPQAWGTLGTSLDLSPGEPPRIRLGWTAEPSKAGASLENGRVEGHLWNDPKLTVAQKRLRWTHALSYCIGLALGVEENEIFGQAVTRRAWESQEPVAANLYETFLARKNLEIATTIREALNRNERPRIAWPQLDLASQAIELGPVVQSERVPFSVALRNPGKTPLSFLVKPDCGCITGVSGGVLAPGETATLEGQVDTREFNKDLSKRLVLLTNDPNRAMVEIPVRVTIRPRYAFVMEEGENVRFTPGKPLEVYLLVPKGYDLSPRSAQLSGIEGDVTFAMRKSPVPPALALDGYEGYRFTITVPQAPPLPRMMVSLTIGTLDPHFTVLTHSFYVHQGVIAQPSTLYLGRLERDTTAEFLLIGPGNKDFEVQQVESDSPYLNAQVEKLNLGRYRVRVTYRPGAPKGRFQARLTIRTGDPTQPEILVPVRGDVP